MHRLLLFLLVVVRRVWGRAIGLGAAAIFSLIMATPYLQGPTANAELFLLLPLLLGLLFLLCADDRPLGGGAGNGLLVPGIYDAVDVVDELRLWLVWPLPMDSRVPGCGYAYAAVLLALEGRLGR